MACEDMSGLIREKLRTAGLVIGILGILPGLGACSAVPDAANPVEWYKGARDWVSGKDTSEQDKKEAEAKPVPDADKPFPNLASVPERPEPTPEATREQIASGLAADRENARYTDEVIRRQTEESVPAAPAEPAPASLPAAAAEPPSRAPAVEAAPPAPDAGRAAPAEAARRGAIAETKIEESASSIRSRTPSDEPIESRLPKWATPPPKRDVPPPRTELLAGASTLRPMETQATEPAGRAPAPAAAASTERSEPAEAMPARPEPAAAAPARPQPAEAVAAAPVAPPSAPAPAARAPQQESMDPLRPVARGPTPPPPSPTRGNRLIAGAPPPAVTRLPDTPNAPTRIPQGASPLTGLQFGGPPADIDPTGGTTAGMPSPAPMPQSSAPPGPMANLQEPAPSFAAPAFRDPLVTNSMRIATIQFGHGSTSLDRDGRRIVDQVAAIFQRQGGRIRVVGHASGRIAGKDPVKQEMGNFTTSLDRANAVVRELNRRGVPMEAVTVVAASDSEPLIPEESKAAEAVNRRAEIFLEN